MSSQQPQANGQQDAAAGIARVADRPAISARLAAVVSDLDQIAAKASDVALDLRCIDELIRGGVDRSIADVEHVVDVRIVAGLLVRCRSHLHELKRIYQELEAGDA